MTKQLTGKELLAYATPFTASISSRVDRAGMPVYRAHVTAHGASDAFVTLTQDEWDGPGSPAEAMRIAEALVETLTERREEAYIGSDHAA